jgi:hypothetical protein
MKAELHKLCFLLQGRSFAQHFSLVEPHVVRGDEVYRILTQFCNMNVQNEDYTLTV